MTSPSRSDTIPVSQLFKNQSTTLDDVLYRPNVVDYLRQISDSSELPKEVLTFVDKHMPKLLAAAQRTTDAVNGSADGARKKNGGSIKKKRPPWVTSPSNSGTPSPRESDSGSNGGAEEDEEKEKERDSKADAKEMATCNINATELLAVYIGASSNFQSAIDRIVPVSVAALGRKGVLIPSVALTVQRVLLAAFEADFVKATETIAITLDEDIVLGTIRNISESSIVAETIIALFGSALSAIAMMAPTTHTQAFTLAWIEKLFPQHLVSFLETAIKTPSCYNYFYFFRELLKRGFSHSAGPVVDVLLQKSLVFSMVETTLRACEEDLERGRRRRRRCRSADAASATAAETTARYGTTELESLSSNAMGVFANTIALVRKSLIVPETPEMYFTSANYVSVVACVDAHYERFMRLLDLEEKLEDGGDGDDDAEAKENDEGSAGAGAGVAADAAGMPAVGGGSGGRRVLGVTRLSICELFTDLIHYHLGSTDRIAVRSNFLQALLTLCRRYHNNDTLIRLLHKNLLSIFSRPLLLGETLQDAMDRDLLLKYVIESEKASEKEAEDPLSKREGGVLRQIVGFAADPAMRFYPLSTFSIDLLHKLSVLPYFSKETSGPLTHLLDSFYSNEAIRKRIDCMREPISGNNFRDEGSARTPPVRHRPLINLAEGEEPSYLGIASPSVKSSPTWSLPGIVATSSKDAEAAEDGDGPSPVALEVAAPPAPFSPQVQAYPSFKDLFIGFSSSENEVKDDVVIANPKENSNSSSF